MKLKIKDMDIATGSVLVAILNRNDAQKLDIHAKDRIKIKKSQKSEISGKLKTSLEFSTGKKIETVIVNVAESKKAVPLGYIGVFEEVIDSLKLRKEEFVEITPARKPVSIDYIKKKLDGKKLNKVEIDQIIWDIVNNKLDEIEITYFVAACYSNRLTMDETRMLTEAMAYHGDVLKLDKHPIIDKHCIGGVAGNRTTMIIVPIVAAAGLTIPKTSSRSITSPAGTADTMEVLSNVSFTIKKMKSIVEKINGCIIWGGAINLAPADDKIIKVEYPLSIDAESQMLASIMAKKLSVSSTHILIDIPVGYGAKVENKKEALSLKKDFEKIGRKLRRKIKVIITDGSEPIGNGIGPALEARDVLWLLKGDKRAPEDLKEKAIKMAGLILELGKKAGKFTGYRKALRMLESGLAYKKMKEIIKAQGAKITEPDEIKLAKFSFDFKAEKKGIIIHIDNKAISKIARIAGAPVDKKAGMYIYKHVGERVNKGEMLFTVYAESKQKLDCAKDALKKVIPIILR